MKVHAVAGFALLSLSLSAIEGAAQSPAPSPEHVVLTRTADGFARANPDGTQSTSNFSIPSGQELCLFDIVFSLAGEPNATTMLAVSNTNSEGASWRILTRSVVLDSQGRGAGHETYKIGAKLSGNSRISPGGTGLSGIGMTVLGLLRPTSTTPCQ